MTRIGDNGKNTLYGGNSDARLNGCADNDTLYGHAGNDRLDGGTVNDYLDGGTGSDDTIDLDRTIFTTLATPGILSSDMFRSTSNGLASDDDFILYDISTGALPHDRDGSGPGAATQFATLANNPRDVTHQDFIVIT